MDDALLHTIAERYGTPTYVYDLGVVRRRLAELRASFGDATLLYAVKANPYGAVLRALAPLGVGAEVITLGELERAARAGFVPASILVGGPGMDPRLVRRAADLGIGLASLDSAGAWQAWRAVGTHATTRFLVRVNPGLDPATHEHLATGAAGSKFGLPPDEALALAREVGASGRLAGFHVHAGSMIRDAGVYDAIGEVLEPLYRALPGLDRLDLGGGFAVPGLALAPFAQRAHALAERLHAELVLEPGRTLVAEAGTLLARVLHVKRGGPAPHLIADAGMADLLRPALYGAEHPIRVIATTVGPAGTSSGAHLEGRATDVDGPLCENADRLGRDRVLPGASTGSLLAVEQAGAYGFAMASNYASSLRPAEVVVDGVDVRLVRRRERPEDLWRLEDEAAG
ncbi:MAG: diaminopimelate decarboxylase [Deinococcales bacterium]